MIQYIFKEKNYRLACFKKKKLHNVNIRKIKGIYTCILYMGMRLQRIELFTEKLSVLIHGAA